MKLYTESHTGVHRKARPTKHTRYGNKTIYKVAVIPQNTTATHRLWRQLSWRPCLLSAASSSL